MRIIWGLVYFIELKTKYIKTEEDELTGIWIHEKDLRNHEESFESWLSLIYEKWLKK